MITGHEILGSSNLSLKCISMKPVTSLTQCNHHLFFNYTWQFEQFGWLQQEDRNNYNVFISTICNNSLVKINVTQTLLSQSILVYSQIPKHENTIVSKCPTDDFL